MTAGRVARATQLFVLMDVSTVSVAIQNNADAIGDGLGWLATSQFAQKNASTEDIAWHQTRVFAKKNFGRVTHAVSRFVTTDARTAERASHLPRVLA